MPSGLFVLHRIAALILLSLAAHCACVAQAITESAPTPPLLVVTLGNGTSRLNGPCQFHPGDDSAWANPAFDSSAWEQINTNQPWGWQGHANLTGFAWYRCNIAILPAPAAAHDLSLLMPTIHDAYEIYWNGSLIGRNGKLPPNPIWYLSQRRRTFALGQVQQGVLAFRVWKAPLLSDDSGHLGGFDAAPLIGTPEAIATAAAADEFHWLRSRQLHFAANLLSATLAFLSLLLWLRSPSRKVLLWMFFFAVAGPSVLLLDSAHLGLPYSLAMGGAQPLFAIQNVSLWFLILWLLCLHDNRTLRRITRILSSIYMLCAALDGVAVVLTSNPQWTRFAQISDTLLTVFTLPMEVFPLILVGFAISQRKRFDSARWLVASLALLDQMLLLFHDAVKQGRQFTGWAIADKVDSPLFFLDGNGISLNTLAETLLLIAIIYAVYDNVREDQRRQDTLEREKLELLHQSDRMRHHAEHDGLTGLLNRRVIVERLGEEIVRSRRDQTPLCVILADVDHFKRINDTFGHLAGDLILKEVGKLFSRTLRSYDCVGRYGGEEFLILLPNCELESALLRGEELRLTLEAERIFDGETLMQVTASFGVALVLPFHDDAETVLRAVDAALYQAKSGGRNCVIEAEMDISAYSS